MKSWTRLDWFIILLFAGLVALFYWRILTPNPADRQSFPPGDFYLQFWAFSTFEVRELSAGRLPLWNPYTFAGSPFWADVQAAVFYPPSLLTLLLSAPWGFSAFALELEAIAHFWLAALFMYLFGREVTASRPAAVIAALTFTFGGYLTGYPSQQLAVLEADVWLPLILYFLHRASHPTSTTDHQVQSLPVGLPPFILHPSSFIPLLLAGLAWGMTLLAGHPQSAFIVACISLAYLAFLSFLTADRREETADRRPPTAEERPPTETESIAENTTRLTLYALRFTLHVSRFTFHASRLTLHASRFTLHALLFLATGLALAAVQFIPAVEYTLLSVRAEGTYDKMSGGFPIIDVIQFLLPGQVSHYSPLYVGVVGLILALSAVLVAPARGYHTLFWGLIAAAALLISFGGNTFLYTPLYLAVPGFSIFRGQERWAFAVAFSLSVLAGYGFKYLTADRRPPTAAERPPTADRRPPTEEKPITPDASRFPPPASRLPPPASHFPPPASCLTQYLFLFALSLVFLFFFGLNQTGWTPASPFYGLLGAATLLTILLALAWLLWRFGPQLHPALFTSLAAALICFDLFSVNWQTNLFSQPPEWHTQMPAAVAAIKKDAAGSPNEPYRVYNEYRVYDNYGVPFEIEDLWGASPLRPSRYDQFLAPPMPIERTWELLNVKYVITWRKELYLPSTIIYEEPTEKDTTYVHRLNQAGPRAWLVNRVEIADDAAILQKIADPNFDRWQIALLEPGAEPFLDETLQENDNLIRNPLPASRFPLPVSRFTAQPSHLTLQVTTDAPALLILSEIDYPGWQATVDGQSSPTLRADYTLRAVPVTAGEHTVELTFRPFSFISGAVITVLSLVVIGAVLFLAWRMRC